MLEFCSTHLLGSSNIFLSDFSFPFWWRSALEARANAQRWIAYIQMPSSWPVTVIVAAFRWNNCLVRPWHHAIEKTSLPNSSVGIIVRELMYGSCVRAALHCTLENSVQFLFLSVLECRLCHARHPMSEKRNPFRTIPLFHKSIPIFTYHIAHTMPHVCYRRSEVHTNYLCTYKTMVYENSLAGKCAFSE